MESLTSLSGWLIDIIKFSAIIYSHSLFVCLCYARCCLEENI